MYFESPLFTGFGILGLIFMFIGFGMKYDPPKGINPGYGYRTKKSLKSQEA